MVPSTGLLTGGSPARRMLRAGPCPMKLRPYSLSQIELGDFTLAGYSVAGEESVIIVPELDVVFDIGKCPREALPVNHVLLSHGHMDHVAGLPYYFAQRDFQGQAVAKALVPANLIEPLEDLMRAWGRVEGHVPPHEFVPMEAGDDYEIRRNLLVRAFSSNHIPGSLGFAVIDVRKKLKAEYSGMTERQIVELKNKGVEITNRTEYPLVAFLGDSGPGGYASLPCVANAKALLLECTFFDDEHMKRARAGRHMHIKDIRRLLKRMNNERVILVHVTRRTNIAEARKILRKSLPKDTLQRVTFLMSKKYTEQD